MDRVKYVSGFGLFVLLIGLIACSDESTPIERLSAYASAEGLLGTYAEQDYANMQVGYVYDQEKDALILLLENDISDEAYLLKEASSSFGALFTQGSEADKAKLTSLKAGEGELLKEFQQALETELIQTLPNIAAQALPGGLTNILALLGCGDASKFIEILLCLFVKAIESSAIGTGSGGLTTGIATSGFTTGIATSGGTSGGLTTGIFTSGGTSGTTSGGTSGAMDTSIGTTTSTSGGTTSTDTAIGTSSSGTTSDGTTGMSDTTTSTSGGTTSTSGSTSTSGGTTSTSGSTSTSGGTSGTTTSGGTDGGSSSASIYGRVWFDKDLNNTQSSEEPSLEGFTVYLDQNNNGELDSSDISTTTNSEGMYEFSGLVAGQQYVVREVLPLGWTNHHISQSNSRSFAVPRIINGQAVSTEEYPYMLSLEATYSSDKKVFCGATLITPSVALTSAECLADPDNTDSVVPADTSILDVYVQGLSTGSAKAQAKVTNFVINPQFIQTGFNAIAAVQLSQSFPNVPRIFLPDPSEDASLEQDGQPAFVLGWGIVDPTAQNVVISSDLRKAAVKVVSDSRCLDMLKTYYDEDTFRFDAGEMCAGEMNQAPCFFDMGGPLYAVKQVGPNDMRHMQLGIFNFIMSDSQCNDPNLPIDIYAQVSQHLAFIKQHAQPEASKAIQLLATPGANQVNFANFH